MLSSPKTTDEIVERILRLRAMARAAGFICPEEVSDKEPVLPSYGVREPDLWRQHFAAFYDEMFRHIQSRGMLAGCLFDGDITAIMDDYLALEPDVVEIMQPNLVGIEKWGELLRGKVAAKASVDMMSTLATGTPEACRAEARRLVEALWTPEGGFMGISLRWHRPEYPAGNVRAVAEAFSEYRQAAM